MFKTLNLLIYHDRSNSELHVDLAVTVLLFVRILNFEIIIENTWSFSSLRTNLLPAFADKRRVLLRIFSSYTMSQGQFYSREQFQLVSLMRSSQCGEIPD